MRALLFAILLFASTAHATVSVAAIGDSLTEDASNDPSWVERLCTARAGTTCSESGQQLSNGGGAQGEVYSANGVTIRNLGFTGNAIHDEIFGRYCRQVISPGVAPGEPYDVVIFEGGVNDVVLGYTAAQIFARWELMLNDAYNRGKRVVVLYDMPWGGYSSFSVGRDAQLQALWPLVAAWCDGKANAVCVSLQPTLDADDNGICDTNMCTDNLHWSATGSAAVATRVNDVAGNLIGN